MSSSNHRLSSALINIIFGACFISAAVWVVSLYFPFSYALAVIAAGLFILAALRSWKLILLGIVFALFAWLLLNPQSIIDFFFFNFIGGAYV